jgi:hypothetical protein
MRNPVYVSGMKTNPIQVAERVPTRLLARVAAVFIVALAVFSVHARASERWATLEAIHQLENPRDSDEPGIYGELGAYQFREETWKMHTQAPFSRALDRRSSDVVAVKHYEWIKSELERRGISVTPYRIALAWNGGIRAVLTDRPPAGVADYAARAANMAAQLERTQLADAR